MRRRKYNIEILVAILVVICVIAVGTIFYRAYEKLSWTDSLYFTATTVTTIGFGDLSPTKPVSRGFTVAYALISIPTMLFCLGLIVEGFLKRRITDIEEEVQKIVRAEDEILKREEKILKEEKKIKK